MPNNENQLILAIEDAGSEACTIQTSNGVEIY